MRVRVRAKVRVRVRAGTNPKPKPKPNLEVAALLAHECHADVGALQVLGELALEVGRLGGDGGRVVRVDLGWGLEVGLRLGLGRGLGLRSVLGLGLDRGLRAGVVSA